MKKSLRKLIYLLAFVLLGVTEILQAANNSGIGISARSGSITGYGYTPGAEISFMSERFQFGLMHFQQNDLIDRRDSDIVNWKYEDNVKHSLSLIFTRLFLNESLYLAMGIGQKSLEIQQTAINAIANELVELNMEFKATSAYLSVGNMWKWKSGFFIGMDWIGSLVNLDYDYSINSNEDNTSADTERLEYELDQSANSIGLLASKVVFVLNVGWNF